VAPGEVSRQGRPHQFDVSPSRVEHRTRRVRRSLGRSPALGEIETKDAREQREQHRDRE